MILLEKESKPLLKKSHIPVPASFIATDELVPAFLPCVIKSQVPTGGRGKAGGIVVVRTEQEFQRAAKKIKDIAIKGFVPKTLLAEELLSIKNELYLALFVDKKAASITLMAHKNGGVEVEENNVADFLKIPLPETSFDVAGERLAEYYDMAEHTFALQDLLEHLFECFVTNDAVLLEINPLILTTGGTLIAGDCKMELDNAAAFRHPEWDFEAQVAETNFVTLDEKGNVATIANGAGLAMATVDAVASAGMKPANFLDIGGGANEASILAAFERIMRYPNVSVIIINIFAGITRCDEVAKAIIAARLKIDTLPPLSIRLTGTNFEQAVTLLSEQGIPTLATLDECIALAKKETS